MIGVACYRGPVPETRYPYIAVCNLRADGTAPPGFQAYDTSSSLAYKNHSYCELSVLRTLPNLAPEAPWLGLVHYRRMFIQDASCMTYKHSSSISFYDLKWLRHFKVDYTAWQERMNQTDVILPCREDMGDLGFQSSYDQFAHHHDESLLHIAEEAIAHLFPQMPSFIDYHRTARSLGFFNMVVAKRKPLTDYMNFLFPILERCEISVGLDDSGYQGRWAGFLGERLQDFWFDSQPGAESVAIERLPVAIAAKRAPRRLRSILSSSRHVRRLRRFSK
jgi:hypothetical protein